MNNIFKKRLDINHIIQKLIEIDKLKALLLDSYQMNLFDYMPREVVQIPDTDIKSI